MVPFFSVIIPTYNRQASLGKCLDSLSRQTLESKEFEVIVVDDGSTDGTSGFLSAPGYPFELRYIRQENAGPSQARNTGVAQAQGRVIALTEDDVVVRPDWLANARNQFDKTGTDLLEGRTVYEGSGNDVRRFEPTQRLSFIPCNLFVKKEMYQRLGGYDPSFYDRESHLYFREDADFGFRALDQGYRVAIARDVVAEHPSQFSDLGACLRHVRRYGFDPLLYKRHKVLFREMIEVKTIAGINIHRPQHYVALIFAAMACWALISLFVPLFGSPVWGIIGAFACGMLFRFKYQGWKVLALYEIRETLGFTIMPGLYLSTLVRGCIRFRSFGVLL